MISETSFMGRAPATIQYFPRLPSGEILKCLAELGISVSKEELAHPEEHKEAIRRLLEYLAEICTGCSREELSQPAFAGLNVLNFPELHEESIPHLHALRNIMKMMEICEIRDFSIRDITAPTASRLNRQLSGIMNFAKFREERLLLLSELNSTRDALNDQLNQMQEKHEALNNRLTLLRNQTQEEADQIDQMEHECADLDSKMIEMKRSGDQYDAEIAQLQEQFNKVSQSTDESRIQYDNLLALQRKLAGQVVTSPEKFRKQIIEVGQSLQHEQKDAKLADKKVRELTAWLSNVEEAQTEVSSALEGVQEIRMEVDRNKALIAELDNQKQSIAALQHVLSELNQNNQQYVRQAARAEEKLQNFRRQVSQRAEESQQNVETVHNQLIEAESFRMQVMLLINSGALMLYLYFYQMLCACHRSKAALKEWKEKQSALNKSLKQRMHFLSR